MAVRRQKGELSRGGGIIMHCSDKILRQQALYQQVSRCQTARYQPTLNNAVSHATSSMANTWNTLYTSLRTKPCVQLCL